MPLKGKKIVLTGGRGGIGRVLAKRLQDDGAQVLIIDREPGVNVLLADLSDETALADLCSQLAQENVDILINLAGLMYFGHAEDQSPQHLAAMINVNLQAPIRLSQAVLPGMKARGSGQIVNIGSVFGLLPFPHFVAYSATKAGLKGFSDAMRRELSGKGISVTHIAPRAVNTGLNGGLIAELHKRTKTVNDDPVTVTERILDAIVKKKKTVVIGFPESLFVRVGALCPALVDNGLRGKRDIADELLSTSTTDKPKGETKMKRVASIALAALMLFPAGGVMAQQDYPLATYQQQLDPVAEQITYLQKEWARIKYQVPGEDSKLSAIHQLETHAARVTAAYPDRPEALIWEGIILSTDAGITKSMSGLPKVKKAKELFEEALRIDPRALDGSAYTSLGSLYYQVPGWPVSFGDDDEAENNLKQALSLNPTGIDANYFYGDFLLQEGHYEEAKAYLERALQAPDRPGRELADAGRRQEIRATLAQLQEKIKDNGREIHND